MLDTMSSAERHGRRRVDTLSSSRGGDPATRRRILDATLTLITRRGGVDVKMADVARAARVSRQALYLHFADRAALFTALVRHADERRGLAEAIQGIVDAPGGRAALLELVAVQARLNPAIWPVARAFDAVRRRDEAAEQSWRDRLEHRWQGCAAMAARLAQEGLLRTGLDPRVAADLLWTLTSLRMWEDLVLERSWSAEQYRERVSKLVLETLTGA